MANWRKQKFNKYGLGAEAATELNNKYSSKQHVKGRTQQLGQSSLPYNGGGFQGLIQQLSGSYIEMLEEKGIQCDNAVGVLHFKNQEDKYKFMYSVCDEDGNSDYLTTNVTRTITVPGIEGVLTTVSYKRDMIAEALEIYDNMYGKSESTVSVI